MVVRCSCAFEAADVRSHQAGPDLTALAAGDPDIHDRSSPSFDDLQHINAGWSSAISKKRNAKITMFSNNNIVIAKLLATIASADPP